MGERSTVQETVLVAPLPTEAAAHCDAAGVIRLANPALAALVGCSDPADLHGRVLDELLTVTGGNTVLDRLDGTQRLVRLIRVPHEADGAVVVLLDLGAPETAEAQPAGAQPAESRSAEVQAAETQPAEPHPAEAHPVEAQPAERRQLLAAQRAARLATWEHDHRTGVTTFSPGYRELLGAWFGGAARWSSLLRRVHSDDRRALVTSWQLHLRHGEPVDYEFRVVLPDGAIRWAELHARTDPAGTPRSSGHIRDVTAPKNAVAALAAERATLLDAQRLARIGSWTYDIATGQATRSEVLLEMYAELGLEPDHDLLFGIDPRDRARAEQARDALLAKTDEEIVETEVRTVGDRIFRSRGRAELGADGTPVRLRGTVQDITRQRHLQRQVVEDRRRYEEAQQIAGLGNWEWVPATDEVFQSDGVHQLFGVPRGEPSSYLRYLDTVHPDDRRWVDERWHRLTTDGGRLDVEHRVVGGDGVPRTVRCHAALVSGVDGAPDRVVGTVQDVTEQRAMQSRMARTSQRFADLVSIAPVGIALFDSEARVLHANDALCELLGRDLETLRGMASADLMHPEERLVHLESVRAIAEATTQTYCIPHRRMLTATGREVQCKLDIRLSVQDDGRHIWIVAFTDITEQRRIAESLRHQATHDDLTGLPNRTAVKALLGELLAGDDPTNMAVLFCDIDNFKRVNDSLGHDAGDELLVVLARRLSEGLSEECTAARLSGDEFVIICSDLAAVGGIQALATKVGALLRLAVPVRGQLVRASASIGAAVPGADRVSGADLLRFADAAMFESKRRGNGRVSVADSALIASADRQVHLEGELREALHNDGLELHYQPVVDPDGVMLTAEALLRWPHGDRTIMPNEFLPIAEQGGLLRDLDRWVLRRALTEAAGWARPGETGECPAEPVSVAVNLSALVPGDPIFADAVADAIAEAGIDAGRVVLELVETMLIDLPAHGTAAMAALSEQGVRFAVDDFGTGYSSLGRLKELPAQVLKVDRSFVAGVAEDPADLALSQAVVQMAHALGRTCVAEGVETAEQFAVLRDVGVRAFQGWLFAKALPAEEFRALLAGGSLPVPDMLAG